MKVRVGQSRNTFEQILERNRIRIWSILMSFCILSQIEGIRKMKTLTYLVAILGISTTLHAEDSRRFSFGMGLERSGSSIINLFNDEESSGISPYAEVQYGNPYGLDFGARASFNLWHDTLEDFPLEASDIDNPVYSDIRAYRQDAFTLDRLYARYSFKAGDAVFGRLTGGILQAQFMGTQLELLYAPEATPFAIGLDVAKVKKRDIEDPFKSADYEVTTGHITAHYDTGYPGFLVSASYGQYLAGDRGTTVTAAKRFNGDWEIRGELTATEHYFDTKDSDYLVPKITLYIPLGAVGQEGTRFPFRRFVSSKTDAGRSLTLHDGLYSSVRGYNSNGYKARWGGM